MSRRRVLIASLVWGMLSAAHPAGAGPCEEDPSLCAPPSGVAACRSIGVLVVSAGVSVGDSSAAITAVPASQSGRSDVATFRQQTPLGIVEASGIHSTCVAYTVGNTGQGRRACGRADIHDLMIDMNAVAGVVITARGLVADGCTGLGPGGGGSFNESRIEQVVLTIDGGSGPVNVMAQPNTGMQLGGGFELWVNEARPVSGACVRNAGSALRIAGPAGSVVVGWVSTAACL